MANSHRVDERDFDRWVRTTGFSVEEINRGFTRGCYAVAVMLNAASLRSFALWSQVTDLRGADPIELIAEGHPHAFRFLLVWPVFRYADFVYAIPNSVFSWLGVGFVIGLMRLTASMAKSAGAQGHFIESKASAYWLLIYIVFLDGRLVFALLGLAMILDSQLSLSRRPSRLMWTQRFPQALLGLFLMCVSSGTFVAGILVTALFFATDRAKMASLPPPKRVLIALSLAGLAGAIIPALVRKNVLYFQDNWQGVLRHGLGAIALVVIAIAMALIWVGWPSVLIGRSPNDLLVRSVFVCAAAGAFGLSGLALATVPLGVLGVTAQLPAEMGTRAGRRSAVGALVKRAFDIAAAVTGLILVLPVLAVGVVMILFESGRPVLTRQPMLGLGDAEFEMITFRTDPVGGPKGQSHHAANGGQQSSPPPKAGARRHRFNKLPTLINVLRGEMSLLGPPPISPSEIVGCEAFDLLERASVRPGFFSSGAAMVGSSGAPATPKSTRT